MLSFFSTLPPFPFFFHSVLLSQRSPDLSYCPTVARFPTFYGVGLFSFALKLPPSPVPTDALLTFNFNSNPGMSRQPLSYGGGARAAPSFPPSSTTPAHAAATPTSGDGSTSTTPASNTSIKSAKERRRQYFRDTNNSFETLVRSSPVR